MAEMSKYCAAYEAKKLRAFAGWSEKVDDLRKDTDDDGKEIVRNTIDGDDVLYVHDSYVVTDDIYKDENVVFDNVTDEWKTFCTESLQFEIPEYEPIEIIEPEAAAEEA